MSRKSAFSAWTGLAVLEQEALSEVLHVSTGTSSHPPDAAGVGPVSRGLPPPHATRSQ